MFRARSERSTEAIPAASEKGENEAFERTAGAAEPAGAASTGNGV